VERGYHQCSFLRSKNVDFKCILRANVAVQLPTVPAKSTAFGLTKLAAAACIAHRQQKAATQACWKIEAFYKQPTSIMHNIHGIMK